MKRVKGLLVVIGFIGLVVAAGYVDYTIYKAKYPNTTLWMWIMDSK
jgi:hypothetical protein